MQTVVVFTGAGMSKGVGLPTWRGYGAEDASRMREQVGLRDLAAMWKFWGDLKNQADEAELHSGYLALVEAEQRLEAAGGRLCIITQNVDGLHVRAGNQQVIELHGQAGEARCMNVCGQLPWAVKYAGVVPRCQNCGFEARPEIVLFGERVKEEVWETAGFWARSSTLWITVGTSGEVFPAAALVDGSNGRKVMVDPGAEVAWPYHRVVRGNAETVLARVLEEECK